MEQFLSIENFVALLTLTAKSPLLPLWQKGKKGDFTRG